MTPTSPTAPPARDLELLMARFRATGDPEALGALFDATAPGLFRLALALVPDPARAEDAVQETFLAAMGSADRFDGTRPVLPWLVGILHHRAEKVRRRARTPDPRRLPPLATPEDPAAAASDREEEERVRAALDGLPEPYRQVALLRWRHGLDPAEIAALTRTPPGTVRSLLHRALEKVRRTMAGLPAVLLLRAGEAPPRGLDAVRRAVMERARALPAPAGRGGTGPGPGTGTGTTAVVAALAGGLLMAKKSAVVVVAALLALGVWWTVREGDGGAPARSPGDTSTVAGAGGTGSAKGSGAAPSPVDAEEPPAAGATAAAPREAMADGIVVDRDGGPVAGATVVSLPDDLLHPVDPVAAGTPEGPGFTVRTGEDGRFRVPLPRGGPCATLYVEAAGFAPTVETEVPLLGGDVRIVLDLPASLAGRVTGPEDAPVAGARVRITWLLDRARIDREAITAADGTYRVETAPPRRRFSRGVFSDLLAAVDAGGFAPLRLTNAWRTSPAAAADPGEEGRLDLRLARGAVVTGRVLDGESGGPVAGARVVLWSIESAMVTGRPGMREYQRGVLTHRTLAETVSGEDGSYRFEGVPCQVPGMAPATFNLGKRGLTLGHVAAMKDGRAPATDEVPLVADGATVDTVLSLWPAAVVEGRVVDGDGRPVEGAGVRVEVEGRRENAWIPADLYPGVPSVAGTTDGDGRYRVAGVRASMEEASPARVLAVRSGAVMLNQSGGVPVEVLAGRTVSAPDLVLEDPPDASISFRVTDPSGAPIWGASVVGTMQNLAGRTGEDGRATLRSPVHGSSAREEELPPMRFTVRAGGYGTVRVDTSASRKNTPEVAVVLGPGHSVAGIVRTADGKPAPAAAVVTVARGDLPEEEAFRQDRSLGEPVGFLASVRLGEDGAFRADDLPPGPYRVRAVLNGNGPQSVGGGGVISTRGAATPVRRGAVVTVADVPSDATGVVLVLPADAVLPTVVEGMAVDRETGDPVVVREARLVPFTNPEFAEGGPDPSRPGGFRFPSVNAGEWALWIHGEGYAPLTTRRFRVAAGEALPPMTISLSRGVTVRGELRLPAEEKRSGWRAQFTETTGTGVQIGVTLDGQGRFESAGFVPGRYRVQSSCIAARFGPGEKNVYAPAGNRMLEVAADREGTTFEADMVLAGYFSTRIVDKRIPLANATDLPEEDRRRAAASRIVVTDASGTVVYEEADLARGRFAFGLILPEGTYTVRLEIPGSEPTEKVAVVTAGGSVTVNL